MGLDMYAFTMNNNQNAATDFEISEDRQELHYWRKHHDLHGWMHKLYEAKGGKDPDFNCNTLQLTHEDLDKLKEDLLKNFLPQTTGFFFGNNPPNNESLQDDLEFIRKAKNAIDNGKTVIYYSWW